MAYTGTLPPRTPRDATSFRGSQPATPAGSEARQAAEQGGVVYFLVLVFTFILLGRPQDLIPAFRNVPIAMVVGLAAIFLCTVGLLTGQIKFRQSRELYLVLGITAWIILGLPFAHWRAQALHVLWIEWIRTVMIFVLLTQTLTTLKRVRHLLWVIFFSGLVATGFSLLLGGELMQDEEIRFLGLTHGFFSGNYLGIALAVILPYMAAMLIHTRSILKQLMLVGTFGTMVALVVVTASRGNMISLIFSLVLVWAVVLRENVKAKMIGVIFVLGLVVSIAFAPIHFWQRVGTLWNSDSYSNSEFRRSAQGSEEQRKELLWRSIRLSFTNPLFGVGIGNFQIVSGEETENAQDWKGTHNTFTQMSSENGLPAFVMFLMLLFTGITQMRRLVRSCRDRPDLAQEKSLANATMVSIIAFMVGGFFAHLAYDYYIYYLAGIGAGLQAVFAQETGVSPELLAKDPVKEEGNGGRRLRNSLRGARA